MSQDSNQKLDDDEQKESNYDYAVSLINTPIEDLTEMICLVLEASRDTSDDADFSDPN
jgi:hypothetical protein